MALRQHVIQNSVMYNISFILLLLSFTRVFAQTPTAKYPEATMPRPIEAGNTLFIEEMTWLEVRDAIKEGKTTAIIAAGGIEQNGPYLATGKHNYILRATTDAIARKLGNALVAPIIPFVPEGDIDPPTLHMLYPGTISVSEKTFLLLLIDIASSLRMHGFKNIILIGDSGGNQKGMKRAADSLSKIWDPATTAIHYIPEYYSAIPDSSWFAEKGIFEKDEGFHDTYDITATIMTVDPKMVRMDQRIKAGKFSINGVGLSPFEKTIAIGKKVVAYRAEKTIEAINKVLHK